MTTINYVVGDATNPIGDGVKFIVHVSNNRGGWGAGFVLALSAKWSYPEQAYREAANSPEGLTLGEVQIVNVEDDIFVINMVAQNGYYNFSSTPAIDYESLRECLFKVAMAAFQVNASVHMPRIGTGLGGGSWDHIEPIIESVLGAVEIPVYVYDLPKK